MPSRSRIHGRRLGLLFLVFAALVLVVSVGVWMACQPRASDLSLAFLEYEVPENGDLRIVFALSNTGSFDYHYQIRTEPSLRPEEITLEMGLLPAGGSVTNRIPFSVADREFVLAAAVFPLPVLPSDWSRRPGLAVDCLAGFVRGESRLMIAYPAELPTNRVFHVRTAPVSAPTGLDFF